MRRGEIYWADLVGTFLSNRMRKSLALGELSCACDQT